jgi:hypothetical protein
MEPISLNKKKLAPGFTANLGLFFLPPYSREELRDDEKDIELG